MHQYSIQCKNEKDVSVTFTHARILRHICIDTLYGKLPTEPSPLSPLLYLAIKSTFLEGKRRKGNGVACLVATWFHGVFGYTHV